MNIVKSIILFLFVFLTLTGCAAYIRPSMSRSSEPEHVFSKNYLLDNTQAAFVGDPIVKVKSYFVKRTTTPYVKATHDFTILNKKGQPIWQNLGGTKESQYNILGEVTLDDEDFNLIVLREYKAPLGRDLNLVLLINKDREGKKLAFMDARNNSIPTNAYGEIKTEPENLKFLPIQKEEIDVNAGYVNYELIYSGNDGKSIMITYREYTNDDIARAAFFQNLVYDSKSDTIRFRDIKIKVHDVSNEKIVYSVIEDGGTQ